MMVRLLIKRFQLLVTLLTAIALWPAQKPTGIPLVPAADWRQMDSETLPLTALQKYGGDPVIENEYGVKSLELRKYQLGKNQIQTLVEVATDPTAAYGLLTYYQTPTMSPANGIQLCVLDPEVALMARGRNFIRFFRPKDAAITDNDFHALLIFVGGTRPSANALASLPLPMPTAGIVPGTEKYLLGLEAARRVLPTFRTDLIGFDQGAEAQLAQYKSGEANPTLIAINYPTPQIARVRLGAMTSFLGINQDHGPTSVYGRRAGSYVFLVLSAENQTAAAKLMDNFRVTQGVSWDKPYPGDKPFAKQVLELILANILLILIVVGLCIVGGVLVFVSKRVAHRFFPQSDWGNPEGESLIRLNLQ